MYIPTQFPIHTRKPKPVKRGEVTLEKSENRPNSAKQACHSPVIMYEQREGGNRRKRNVKPLLDTRVGRDRRFNPNNPGIDIKA